MFEELKNEKIIIEFKNLVDKINEIDDEIEAYCEFMKGMILSTSGKN